MRSADVPTGKAVVLAFFTEPITEVCIWYTQTHIEH
jgi:hypothetical protein